MKYILLPFLLLTIAFASCEKPECPITVYCNTGYNFVLVGFDTSELDTVVFRVYKAGTNFSELLDTAVAVDTLVSYSTNGPTYTWLPFYGTERDSLINGSGVLENYLVADGGIDTAYTPYDWEVFIPKDQKTFKISGINITGQEQQTIDGCDAKGNMVGGSCYWYMTSCQVNGKTYNHSSLKSKDLANFIFLNKKQ